MADNSTISHLASQISSVEIFTFILLDLDQDKDDEYDKIELLLELAFKVCCNHPEFAAEINYILSLYLFKSYTTQLFTF